MAACKCPRPKITISCNFRNLRSTVRTHVLDLTDLSKCIEVCWACWIPLIYLDLWICVWYICYFGKYLYAISCMSLLTYNEEITTYFQNIRQTGIMPRKRKTRATQNTRPTPTLPDGDEGRDLEKELREEKLQTLLKDFDYESMTKPCMSTCNVWSYSPTFLIKEKPIVLYSNLITGLIVCSHFKAFHAKSNSKAIFSLFTCCHDVGVHRR